VLDDAFQHRRAQRVADLVLVSADRWTGGTHLLPAGPWREPLTALRRASLVIVTRKAAPEATVEEVNRRVAEVAPGIPRVSLHLSPGELVAVSGEGRETQPLSELQGRRVHAALSIGDPAAFVAQLRSLGARVTSSEFPDHHQDHHNFTAAEVDGIVRGAGDADCIVCTLKDAVKLGPLWPRLAPPLWYVSQRVTVERGVGGIEHLLDGLVRARFASSQNAG
jgi:tetraacyldisaccharide 4'-kinase